jgi:mannonate dehydratase
MMSAIAAVDTALWDIKGKVAGLPVYQLLGGRCREGVTVYGHADADTVDGVLEEVARYREMGYRAVRVQAAVPGTDAYGVRHDGRGPERAGAARPVENVWSTERYLDFIPSVFARVRAEFGPELKLLHDVHHRLTPIEAARLGRALEPYALTWLEDPVPAELQEGYRLIRGHTCTPLAVGEVFNSIWDCHTLITEQLIDYVRVAVVHAGGISHVRRIFDLASLFHVRGASHGAADLSPVCMAAALHVDVSVPNFGLQEYARHTPETDTVFPHGYRFEAGYLHPSQEPGLGVDIDERLAAHYRYEPAYLPVNRLEDGTMHSW